MSSFVTKEEECITFTYWLKLHNHHYFYLKSSFFTNHAVDPKQLSRESHLTPINAKGSQVFAQLIECKSARIHVENHLFFYVVISSSHHEIMEGLKWNCPICEENMLTF